MAGAGGIALMLVCIVSVSGSIWQYIHARNTHLLHLQATLTRPAETSSQKIQDNNLKAMSYDMQVKNPLGMTTKEAAALLARVRQGVPLPSLLMSGKTVKTGWAHCLARPISAIQI